MCLECIPPGAIYARDYNVAFCQWNGEFIDWIAVREPLPLPLEPGVTDIVDANPGNPRGVEYFVPAGWVHPSDR